MSKIEVNAIEPQCGTTLTLGASGDTVTLASGASQSGFGRTGTVDWDTTAKTASFTAVSGNGYFVNTTSGVITVTLPASPSAGDIVAVADYAGTAATNNITIARNGSNINGSAADLTISKNNSAITLVYVDGTQGWKGTETSNLNDIELQPAYIVATGGTETTSGNFKIHTFTGPGTFTVNCAGNPLGSTTVDYLVVAGGAGGGGSDNGAKGGGGGAGGYRESSGTASGCYTASPLGACVSALPVTAQGYPITVGGGGAAGSGVPINNGVPDNGSNSVFSTITSAGGGKAATYSGNVAGSGGSGGGGAIGDAPDKTTAGSGNTPPVSPPQGSNGGTGTPYCGANHASRASAGGGGATAVGGNGGNVNPVGGVGGAGATTSISGSPTAYAGGGGGAGGTGLGGAGGTGGGGPGHTTYPGSGVAGTVNTGGGGGAAGVGTGGSPGNLAGGAGGSGIVIIRYKYQ